MLPTRLGQSIVIAAKMDFKKFIAELNKIEKTGAAFFSRNSDNSYTVNVRGKDGNDHNQWINARKIQEHFGPLAGEITPDPHSGHLVIKLKAPKA